MLKQSFRFRAGDGTAIFVFKWSPEKLDKARGVVQIAHGMAEHARRYGDFAEALVRAGYIVYANDHRGHGKTAGSPENIGFFADKDGWELVVEDMHHLTGIIHEENPGRPVFLFGHSMGSLLARNYSFLYGKEIEGVILSGTAGDPGFMGTLGLVLAKWEMKRMGKRAKSPLLNRLTFAGYNKPFKPTRTEFDWLSRDQAEVDKYIEDPYCGGIFTANFFYDLLRGMKEINRWDNIIKTPKELPICLLSGDKDPVGGNTKGVMQVYRAYQKAGIRDLSYRFYQDGRHEILKELNREEVISDIIDWLNAHC